MKIEFTVPSVPIAQPRQRHRIIASKGKLVSNYTPTKSPVNVFKASVQYSASIAMKSMSPLEGPLRLRVLFVMPRPLAMMKKKSPNYRAWHAKKPDIDNLEKSLKDALTKIAWFDDAQVCEVFKQKVIASGVESPHVVVSIEQIEVVPQ